ncbi:Di-copper centre-containing protein [Peniophora sp. CONT]|nr:Di-copper centre-containing protein [Peniophora sp. CONT]
MQPRLEINDFVQDPVRFSLYVQAIERMYQADQAADPRSHFQIGGIHGKPYEAWDGLRPAVEPTPKQWRGYCTHGMVTFPTWHRPYVVLYEQILQQHAVNIASEYRDAGKFTEAAKTLRVPYWDWASSDGAVPPPAIITEPLLNILRPPDGAVHAIANPLLKYTFHPVHDSFCPPIFTSPTTLRHPRLNANGEYESDVESLQQCLNQEHEQTMYKTYMMLISLHTWPLFSNHRTNPPNAQPGVANSLESVHDSIHRYVGGKGPGHMGATSMAGFDPIFFLHHCNVDRMLSLWRALNFKVWVTRDKAGDGGSITIPPDALVDANTELTPFRVNPNQCWASAGLETTQQFGYTYPEFDGLDMNNPSEVRDQIAKKINELYGGIVFGSLGTEADPGDDTTVIYDWTARVRVKQYEVGTSFSVLIFIGGEIPEADRRLADTYVGSFDTFVNTDTSQCENCQRQRDQEIVVEGFVHLNLSIVRLRRARGQSLPGSFDPHIIEPYLEGESLQWCIEKADGETVVLTEDTSLEVTVIATPLTRGPGETLPTVGEPKFYHGITAHRRGGSHGEE